MVRSVLSFLGYFEQNSIKEKLDSKKLIGYTCIGNHKGKQRNHKRLAKTIQILILTVSYLGLNIFGSWPCNEWVETDLDILKYCVLLCDV